MPYFADAAVRSTRGDRGKSTRRKSTRTVRGPEGGYIAEMKEELGPRVIVALTGWWVRQETHHPKYPGPHGVASSHSRVFTTSEEADAYAARLVSISGTDEGNGWVYDVVQVEETTYPAHRHAWSIPSGLMVEMTGCRPA